MIPTFFGVIIAIIGAVLMFRASVPAMLWLLMGCSVFGGSAALILPVLGNASIQPAQFALIFLLLRILLPGSRQTGAVSDAARDNLFLGLFAAYGVAAATIAPRLFAGAIQVVPTRFTQLKSLFATVPLQPTPQNVTVSTYMVGTFLVACAVHVAMRDPKAPLRFVKVGVVIAWVHIFFGVSGALLRGTAYDFFINLFRNATYSQTEQNIGSFVRINGIFSEPSGYASFGFYWCAFLFECWFRDVLPRRTGPAAAVLALVLLLSTSSTAYVCLAGYSVVMLLRALLLPQSIPARKGLAIGAAGMTLLVAICAIFFIVPDYATQFWDVVQQMTVGKQNSASGLQRAFWARIGLHAFEVSWGMGIGPGSFRSSSIATAMIGSVGVIGTGFFVIHLLRVWKPMRLSTYFSSSYHHPIDQSVLIGAAAGWTALAVLMPGMIIGTGADPGADFGMFCGVALSLRAMSAASRTRSLTKSGIESAAQVPWSGRPNGSFPWTDRSSMLVSRGADGDLRTARKGEDR